MDILHSESERQRVNIRAIWHIERLPPQQQFVLIFSFDKEDGCEQIIVFDWKENMILYI